MDLAALKAALNAAGFRTALDRGRLTVAAGDGDLIVKRDGWFHLDGPATDSAVWAALAIVRHYVHGDWYAEDGWDGAPLRIYSDADLAALARLAGER
jgi:hypothetical protein